MPSIEITRTGSASVAGQIDEMREWLRAAGIAAVELEPVNILRARVRFRAVFATAEEAKRFRLRFDEAAADSPS